MTRTSFAAIALLTLSACSKPPVIEGQVTDIFGKPLVSAKVVLEGVPEHVTTDADGKYSFEALKTEMRFLAGKENYIQAIETAPALEDGQKGPLTGPTLELLPDPKTPGFYLVADKYVNVPTQKIETVGTELKGMTGVKSPGDATVPGKGEQMFVFKSGLRASEIAQINLQLHQLDFIEEVDAKGVLGEEPVKLNLWVAKDRQSFDLEGTTQDTVYVIRTQKALPKGVYAFHTQDMMTANEITALDKLPKEQRVAYTFEVK